MKLARALAAMGLALFAGSPAQAAFVSYLLNQTNVNPTLADGVNYAQVTIDDNTANTLTFTVSLLSPLTSIAGTNFGIQEFGFNVVGTNPILDAAASNAQWTLPSAWAANVPSPNNQLDGFGRFDVGLSTTGSGRQSPLTFSLLNTGLTLASFAKNSANPAGEGNVFFAAHITGFNAGGGVTSAYFGGSQVAAVPLPASLPLLFAGMGLMGWLGRRRAI